MSSDQMGQHHLRNLRTVLNFLLPINVREAVAYVLWAIVLANR